MKRFDLLPSAKIYKKILLFDSISVGTILIYYHKCTMVGMSKDCPRTSKVASINMCYYMLDN